MSETRNYTLPYGWMRAKLQDVLPISYGKGLTEKVRDSSGSVPVYGSSGIVGRHTYALTTKETLIIGRKGSVGEVHYSSEPCWAIDTTYFVEDTESTCLKYWLYLLKSLDLVRLDRSTAIPGLSRDDYNEIEVAIAPFPEQHRIVAEIETQFTRLDAAIAALKRVQANLKRYRASVLHAACEGRLVPTEAELAHAEGRSYEAADHLLKRILQERRAKWEAEQLADMKAKGKVPKDDRWKSKYKEPVKPDTDELPELSEGWVWTNLLSIAEIKGGITKGQKRKSKDVLHSVPYLRVANVQRGFLDLTEIKQIEATGDEISELRLVPGDILFNEGGDRDKLGRGWIWRGEIPNCIHQNHVFRARLYIPDIQSKLISWYGNSFGQQYFMSEGKQTTNLASINLTKLGALPIPLPPLSEQQRIVAEVERRLSVIDELDATIAANLKRADRLRQSILKRAFEGKLVPQDPTDEPASVLLERIRAEREHKMAQPKATRPKINAHQPSVPPKASAPVQGELALGFRE